MYGLSLLAFITICATIIAAVTFFSNRQKLEQVVNREVPTLMLAAELTHAGEAIASGVAPVAIVREYLEVDTIVGEIADKFIWMDDLINRLEHQGTDSKSVDTLRAERANIQENFMQLQATVSTYWHVRQRNTDRRQQLHKQLQLESKSSTTATTSPALSALERTAALYFSQALVAGSEREIKAATRSLKELEQHLAENGSTATGLLLETANRLQLLSKTATTLLTDELEESRLQMKIAEQVTYHKHLSDRMTTVLGGLLDQRKTTIAEATTAAEEALTISSILLLGLSVLSLLLVGFLALALDRNISARLRKLQESMQLVASGERSVDIPDEGRDEIGEMGRSLSTFVNTLNHQERSLRRARNEAVQANRAKSLFLANVSHELRTPLNAILGFSEIIRTGALGKPQPSRYGDYANDIHESGQHLLDLINDILDMAKIEAGKTELRETIVNVSSAVNDALRIVSQLAREAHITIETEIPPVLPPLWADSRMLVQMCTNLVENAIDSSPPGSAITVSANVNELGQLVVMVEDRGMGMSPSEVDRALKPLEREDVDTTREVDGTGLGLPLISQYVKLHDGDLVLDSHPGKGTVAKIVFPASRIRSATDRHLSVIDGKA